MDDAQWRAALFGLFRLETEHPYIAGQSPNSGTLLSLPLFHSEHTYKYLLFILTIYYLFLSLFIYSCLLLFVNVILILLLCCAYSCCMCVLVNVWVISIIDALFLFVFFICVLLKGLIDIACCLQGYNAVLCICFCRLIWLFLLFARV